MLSKGNKTGNQILMKLIYVIFYMLFTFSLNSFAQTKLNFNYNYFSSAFEETRVSVLLKNSNDEIKLLSDTATKFENSFNIPSEKTEYILSVEFENITIGKDALDYPFSLAGDETDIQINLNFQKSNQSYEHRRTNVFIEIIKYYKSNHNIEIKYLPEIKGSEYYREPFFLLKNNSNDTLYGQHLEGYFWGSLSFLVDSVWSKEFFGSLDYNFEVAPPLLPDSSKTAYVGSFGWQNKLPKNRYKYTLLYSTDKNSNILVRKYSENNKIDWWTVTKKYYRLIYEFDVE